VAFYVEKGIQAIFDPNRMRRVLFNLLENSRKAIQTDGQVQFKASRKADQLVFTIEDDGEGMSEQVQNQIFEPFYSSSSEGGTGLGMLIVKHIVDAHKGTIQIESKIQEGTKITVSIPAHC
jgi:two-component system phosphate regulon sensor histidine kinase PhoR